VTSSRDMRLKDSRRREEIFKNLLFIRVNA
jgi:hypothetical protein